MNFYNELNQREIAERFSFGNVPNQNLIDLLTSLQAEPSLFDESLFSDFLLSDIHNYIKTSHQYYLHKWLPKINDSIYQLAIDKSCHLGVRRILYAFVEKYRIELEQHIDWEEKILINFIAEMLNNRYDSSKKDFVVNHFLFSHNDNVIVQLDELKNDLEMFDKNLKSNLVFQILFNQLEIFQNDLMLHGLIEDRVYIPKMLDHIDAHFDKLDCN